MAPSVPIQDSPFPVMVFLKDHAPAHVHVIFNDGDIKVELAEVTVVKQRGNVKAGDIRRACALIKANLRLC
jgi:hypothetical protein